MRIEDAGGPNPSCGNGVIQRGDNRAQAVRVASEVEESVCRGDADADGFDLGGGLPCGNDFGIVGLSGDQALRNSGTSGW